VCAHLWLWRCVCACVRTRGCVAARLGLAARGSFVCWYPTMRWAPRRAACSSACLMVAGAQQQVLCSACCVHARDCVCVCVCVCGLVEFGRLRRQTCAWCACGRVCLCLAGDSCHSCSVRVAPCGALWAPGRQGGARVVPCLACVAARAAHAPAHPLIITGGPLPPQCLPCPSKARLWHDTQPPRFALAPPVAPALLRACVAPHTQGGADSRWTHARQPASEACCACESRSES
jgi:hypothetical protein